MGAKVVAKKKKRWNAALSILSLTIFAIFACAMYVRYRDLCGMQQQLEESCKQQRKVISKNIELVNKIAYHDSDEYIEKIARDQLGLVKPNEIVFIDENK